MESKELDIRRQEELIGALDLADSVVQKTYRSYFNRMEIIPVPAELEKAELNDFARFFKVERFVYEKNENIRDKLVSVFHAVSSCGGSVIVIVDSNGEKTDYYFGTRVAHDNETAGIGASVGVLSKSLAGNFPGTKIANVTAGSALDNLLKSVFEVSRNSDELKQICTVTGIASLRYKEESRERLFIQGIEKLIDSMRGETYSLLLIADPVFLEELQIIKRGYENLYSQLAPFAGSELNFGQNESTSVSNSITEGLSKSINKSVTDTLTHTEGTSESDTTGTTDTKGMNINPTGILGVIGVGIGSLIAPGIGTVLGGMIGGVLGSTVSINLSSSKNESSTHSTNESTSKSRAETEGTTDTASTQKGVTDSATEGKSRGIQIKFENKAVKNLLEKIDLQLKRLDASADSGLWNCAVYCLADNPVTCKTAASAYQALLRGENSSVETGVITEWTREKAKSVLPWLKKMCHPKLLLAGNPVTPAALVSSAELAIHAGLPQSSVGGLPVLEMAPFGREVQANRAEPESGAYNRIALGSIYHMGCAESLPVKLDKNSLASHTFITGSTGSGKSNTVYQILNEVQNSGGTFLVVEPAKGEYKNVFGSNANVSVYGTNPALAPLLRINPFKFPHGGADAKKNIHILEHLDRLVEIFNVCWPMYAAMPAVLKDAIEAAYEEAGWDLRTSKCRFTPETYPAFIDVTNNIRRIIESSEYSEENKGNYKGALITRLKSLCNGINGMIFTHDDLSAEDLFDKNVIVDLSRVGSMETKALIMGLLVMKLQEHRITSGAMNAGLRHITVLEEAHTLLKRTSTEQSSEGANLLGKSVEMLANAIAEMRTYGEGFIIADQSPGLLDMSVIRNTNTKIILRLPDESDRELVGKAASLNDDQIVELARLQCGVAAVYQNDWIQPVLCKVREYKDFDKEQSYHKPDAASIEKANALAELTRLAAAKETVSNLKEVIEKIDFADFRTVKPETIAALFPNNAEVFSAAVNDEQVVKAPKQGLHDYLVRHIEPALAEFKSEYRAHILKSIVSVNCKYHANLRDIPAEWELFVENLEARHV